jgi:hypothetical protein
MWFQLRSPELAEDFENLMTGDRDIVRGSLETVSDWRLTRPADVPGQAVSLAHPVVGTWFTLEPECFGESRWQRYRRRS